MTTACRSGSLFTGTAALDMAAAEIFDTELAWCADLDPGAATLLAHHFPDVPNLGDITKVNWDKQDWVHVLTLGWPCQPWSLAGKRKGADDERALWPECDRAIRALRPRYLLLENVPAVVAAGELERVATSLATLGYRFAWVCLPASAVGAPHRRERFFLVAVADAEDERHERPGEARDRRPGSAHGRRATADTHGYGVREQPEPVAGRRGPAVAAKPRAEAAADTAGPGPQGIVGPGATSRAEPQAVADAQRDGGAPLAHADGGGCARDAERDSRTPGGVEASQRDDAVRRGVRLGAGVLGAEATSARSGAQDADWAGYTSAIRRWERITGRHAPAPTVLSGLYLRQLARHREAVRHRLAGADPRPVGMRGSLAPPTPGYVLNPALPEWMMGLPDGWITAVPGLSRSAQLKLAGNGVVKHQAVAAYRYLIDVLERDARGAA